MLTSDFSTCYTSLGDTREHPEFGIENKKKVKVRGYVCDVCTLFIKILINPFSKTHCVYMCSVPFPSLTFSIQVDITFKQIAQLKFKLNNLTKQ